MKKQNENLTDAALLRKKAEKKLNTSTSLSAKIKSFSEAEMLKLIYELEVHQIELEMQNEELVIAKEKAEFAEEKYTELYDFAPYGYLSLSEKGEILQLNFAAANILGKERTKLVNKRFDFFVSKDTQITFNYFFKKVFATKLKQTCEVIIATNGNLPIYVKIDGIISHDEDLCLLTLNDITEGILAKKELQGTEEKYRLSEFDLKKAQRISHLGNWELNIETNELFWSEEIYRIFDCEPHEFKATYEAFLAFIHPEDRDKVNAAYLKSLQEKTEYQIEHRIITKNNQIKYVREKCTSTFDEKGNPLNSFGIVIDISEQKALEFELAESAERYKSLHNASFGGIAIHDKGIILECNKGLSEMTGYSLEELIGMDGMLLIAAEHRELVMDKIVTGSEKPYEANGLRKNGEQFPMRLEARNIPYKGKNIRTVEFRDITESKIAEEALRRSEAKLSALFTSMLEMVVLHELVFDEEGKPINYRITDCNDAFTKITGISRDSAVGKLATELYGAAVPPYFNEFKEVALTGKPYHCETYYEPMDKHLYISVICPEKNHFATITTNITERKQAEDALRESEKEYRNLIEFSPVAMAIIHDWKTVYLNPAAVELFGAKKQDELLGKHIYELIHPDFHELAIDNAKLLAEKGYVVMQEQKYIKLDGTILDVETQAKSIRFNDNVATLVVMNDITERKQAEQLIQDKSEEIAAQNEELNQANIELIAAKEKAEESEERYRGLLTNLETGVVVHAKDTSIILSNSRSSELLGLSEDQMKGKVAIDSAWHFIYENYKPLPVSNYPVIQVLNSKQPIKNQVFGVCRKNNDITWLLVSGFPVFNNNDEILEIVISFIDITERKQAELLIQDKSEEIAAQNEELNLANIELIAARKKAEESEARFRNLMESIDTVAVQSYSPEGITQFWNKASENLYGYTQQEAIGKNLLDLIIPPEMKDVVINAIDEMSKSGKAIPSGELVLKHKDGSPVSVISHHAIVNVPGHEPELFCLDIDISQRKILENEVKESEERFNLAMKASNDGLFDWNLETNDIYYSTVWKKMLGYEDDELPNDFSVWEKTTHPNDVKKSWDLQQKLITKQIDRFVTEFKMKHKDGHWVDILARAEVIFNESGKAMRMIGTHSDITERKRAENVLRESEERFFTAFQTSPYAITITRVKDGKFIEVNDAFITISGYTREDAHADSSIGMKLWKNTEDRAGVVKELLAGRSIVGHEYLFLRKGKIPFIGSFSARIILLGGEQCILSSIDDITERKQAEMIAIKERAISDTIIESIPGAFYMIDENGRYVRWNAYQRDVIVGKTDSMVPFTNAIDTIHPDDREMVGSRIANVLINGIGETVEGRVLLHGGPEYRWLLMTGRRVMIEEKPYLLGIGMDITERKQAEEKLIKSEERYALGLEASEQGIWDWNVETNEVFYSSQWKKQIGYKDHELKSEFNTWVDHLHPDEKDYCLNAVENYLKKPIEHFILDFRFRHKDGTYRWIHNKAASIKNNEGKVIRLFGTHTDITDSKLNEAIFKDIIEKNPMSIQILDMEGYPLQVNPAHTKLFGVDPPADYSIFKDAQLLSLGFDKLFEHIKKGKVVFFPDTYYNVHDVNPSFPDSPVWVKALGFTLNDIGGNPNKIVLMHENITERKNAESLLNDIIENNPLSIQIADIKGHTLRVNPAFVELFGAVPPQDFSIFDDLMKKSNELATLVSRAKKGEIVHLPDTYFNAHDAVELAPDVPLWIRALIFPLKDSAGKPRRFVFMHENITERKFAEQEIIKAKEQAEESEKKFREMAELLPQIVFETDIQGNLTYINKYAYKMTGYSEQDSIIGKSTLDFYIPEDRERAMQSIKMRFTSGKPHESNEYTMIRKDGSTFNILVYSNPIFRDSKPVGLRGIIVDISELKQTEQELIKAKLQAEESDRLKSSFLANMSHEIRTPMNGILGFSELLKEPELTGEEQQAYIAIIEKSGRRMLNIINDIVDISKIEAGLMNLDISESNINEQIEYIYTFFKPEVEAKGMKLCFRNSLITKEAIIKTDREKLYAILTNLVKNAIKYSNSGTIEFGYIKRDKSLEFYVKDTGIGIPKDRQEAIFERFIQADISDKMARQGAGLGLAITKSYIEMMGGKIWVESNEGIGSTFYFTLPYNLESGTKKIDLQQITNEKNEATRKLKIIIAEDDEVSEKLIDSYIKIFGKEILKARTGVEVVEQCRSNPDIDLILMDIRMPVMDGYEAIRQIRKFNKDVIIIAQTAYGLTGDRDKSMDSGCNDYIAKPIKKIELQNLIKKYFGN